VLFVSKRFLFPMDEGGKIRTGKLLEKLRDRFEISLVSHVEHPKDDPHLPAMRSLCADLHLVPWRPVDRTSWRFYVGVLRRIASRHPVAVANDYSAPFARAIRALLHQRRHDLLVCDFLQPSINLPAAVGVPQLLFQHNVESVILERHVARARPGLHRHFWRSQWHKMERFEREACRRFDGVVAVSDVDRRLFESRFGARRVFAIPTAVDTEYFRSRPGPVEEGSLVFTGAMDWLPNEDAILFFGDEILDRVKAAVPSVTLTVVGRNPSRRLRRRLEGRPEIRFTGRVDDVRPFMERHAVYVVPLRIGGGTRIKVYEAMAMGKAVVSTPVGVEGLPVSDGDTVVLAERADGFARAVVDLLKNPDRRQRIEQAARRYVETHCSWDRAAAAFAEACHAIVGA
jgi:glycosyltransferase involved in cell wall biosynthesis